MANEGRIMDEIEQMAERAFGDEQFDPDTAFELLMTHMEEEADAAWAQMEAEAAHMERQTQELLRQLETVFENDVKRGHLSARLELAKAHSFEMAAAKACQKVRSTAVMALQAALQSSSAAATAASLAAALASKSCTDPKRLGLLNLLTKAKSS